MANPTTNYGWPMPTSADLVTDLPADFALFGQPVDTSLKALNPETTLGDIAYRSATSNTNTRLGIGTNGQVLAVSGGVPAWTTTADVTPLTTKGDLFTFSTVDARLGVGSNNQILVADSAEATGLKWATASSGALTLISTTTFSAVASQSFNSVFSSTYTNYLILGTGLFINTGTSDLRLRYRVSGTDSTSGSYIVGGFKSTNLALTNSALQTNYMAFGDIGTRDEGALQFTSMRPNLVKDCGGNYTWNGTNFNNPNNSGGGAVFSTATAFDGFTIYAGAGNLSGTISIYGIGM